MLTNLLDTLLDLHAKLSSVVRSYDRMLEERLSSAYSQHNIGPYGSVPPGRQPYSNYPPLGQNQPDGRGAAENFYLQNAVPDQYNTNFQPQKPQHTGGSYTAGTPAPGVGSPSPYPTLNPGVGEVSPNQGWNQNNPQAFRPPSVADSVVYPGQYGAPPGAVGAYPGHGPVPQESAQVGSAPPRDSETPYQPSPIVRRDSQYQQQATAPDPYAAPQQYAPTGEPPQQGYHHQEAYQPSPVSQFSQPAQQPPHSYSQPPPPVASAYPPTSPPVNGPYAGYAGTQVPTSYPTHTQFQEPAPPKPIVEESLIDL